MKFLNFNEDFQLFLINGLENSWDKRLGYKDEYNGVSYEFSIISQRYCEVYKGKYKFLEFTLDRSVETLRDLHIFLHKVHYPEYRYKQLTLGRLEYIFKDFVIQLPMYKTSLEDKFKSGEVEAALFDFTILLTKAKDSYITSILYAGDIILSARHTQIELDSIYRKAQKCVDVFYRLS